MNVSSHSPDLLDGGSLHGIDLQHVFKQADNRMVQVLRCEEDAVADLFEKCWHMIVIERKRST